MLKKCTITGKGGRVDADGGIVGEHQEADGRRAGERVALDPSYLIVCQVEVCQIVQTGKGELSQPFERRVLHRELLQPSQTAEGERLNVTDGVAVQIQFTQRFVALESVRFQMA